MSERIKPSISRSNIAALMSRLQRGVGGLPRLVLIGGEGND